MSETEFDDMHFDFAYVTIRPVPPPEVHEHLAALIEHWKGPIAQALRSYARARREDGEGSVMDPLSTPDAYWDAMDPSRDEAMIAGHEAIVALESALSRWTAHRDRVGGRMGYEPDPIASIEEALRVVRPALAFPQTRRRNGHVEFQGSVSAELAKAAAEKRAGKKGKTAIFEGRDRLIAALVRIGSPHSPSASEIAEVMTLRYRTPITPAAVSAAIQHVKRSDELRPADEKWLPDHPAHHRRS